MRFALSSAVCASLAVSAIAAPASAPEKQSDPLAKGYTSPFYVQLTGGTNKQFLNTYFDFGYDSSYNTQFKLDKTKPKASFRVNLSSKKLVMPSFSLDYAFSGNPYIGASPVQNPSQTTQVYFSYDAKKATLNSIDYSGKPIYIVSGCAGWDAKSLYVSLDKVKAPCQTWTLKPIAATI